MSNNAKREWNEAAEKWVESIGINVYRNNILLPRTVELIGEVEGKNIIDIGCGEGGYARVFADKGAEVVGIDYSDKLIDKAQEQNLEGHIKYFVRDARDLHGIQSDEFHGAVSAMCIMAVQELDKVIKEIYRVLKEDGVFVASILHPCFSKRPYFQEGSYEESLSKNLGTSITFWHKTLSSVLNTIISCGFKIEYIEEPQVTNNNVDDEKETPMFMIIKARK